MTNRWRDIWSKPPSSADDDREPTLLDLIIADGFDTGFGDVEVDAWRDFVDQTCDWLALEPGDSLFDVGCGAGAFLHPAFERGIEVGGIDYSQARIEVAARAMPGGSFTVGEAAEVDPSPAADAVISFSVFQYFGSLEYARRVIERMCSKASRAVAILDVPDIDLAEQALAKRRAAAGGAETYATRYAGLDHLAYSRDWLASALEAQGLRDVAVEPQTMASYDNARFRFNAWGWVQNP